MFAALRLFMQNLGYRIAEYRTKPAYQYVELPHDR